MFDFLFDTEWMIHTHFAIITNETVFTNFLTLDLFDMEWFIRHHFSSQHNSTERFPSCHIIPNKFIWNIIFHHNQAWNLELIYFCSCVFHNVTHWWSPHCHPTHLLPHPSQHSHVSQITISVLWHHNILILWHENIRTQPQDRK